MEEIQKTIYSRDLGEEWRETFVLEDPGEVRALRVFMHERMPKKISLVFRLRARGARALFSVAAIGYAQDNISIDISMIHEAPDTYGRVFARSMLFDASKFSMRAFLDVTPAARGSDTYFLGKAISMSSTARAEFFPYLEIKTHDVKASHGSSVGRVDPKLLFYLESRGIEKVKRERIIMNGFFRDCFYPQEDIKHAYPFIAHDDALL